MNNPERPLRRFQALVRDDRALQVELRRAPDRGAFVALVVTRAGERGLAIAAAEVEAELEAAKRTWTLQWLSR